MFPIHPAAELFPMIDSKSFELFKADIKMNGQVEPVKVFNGKLLDGRNRQKACEEIGMALDYVDVVLREGETPVDYVISTNLHRRHLKTAQRAAIAAELANMVVGGKEANAKAIGSNDPIGISNDDAAAMMGVSSASVKRAKKIMHDNPEQHKQTKAGLTKTGKKRKASGEPKYGWVVVAIEEGVLSPNVAGQDRSECRKDLQSIDDNPDLFTSGYADDLRRACIFLRIQRDPNIVGQAELDAQAACVSLTDKEEKQVNKAIRLARRHIEYEIQSRVTEQLQTILPTYKKRADECDRIKKSYKGVFTNLEFKKLLAFLHSDRYQDDLMKKKADVLFKLVKANEDLLCKPKMNGDTGTLPGNVADLMAMRKTKM